MRNETEEDRMSKDLTAEQQGGTGEFSRVFAADGVYRKDGEPADPRLQRRYRLYKRVEAALALPAGPERLAALHGAMIDGDGRKR